MDELRSSRLRPTETPFGQQYGTMEGPSGEREYASNELLVRVTGLLQEAWAVGQLDPVLRSCAGTFAASRPDL
jgi:hypothetical protein